MPELELSRTADALQEQAAEVVVALHQRQKADGADEHELVRRIGAVWEWYMAVPRERDPMIVARERLRSLQGYLEERTINDPVGVLGPVPAAGFTFPPNYAALKPRPAPEKLALARVVLILDVDGVLVRLPPGEGVRLLHTVDEEGNPWDLDVFDLVPLDDILEEFPAPELEVAFLSSWATDPHTLDQLIDRLPNHVLRNNWILGGRAHEPDDLWKLHAVKELEAQLSPDTALAWVDDRLRSLQALDPAWAADTSRPRLLLSPHPETGLLPGDLRRLRAFVQEHAAPVSADEADLVVAGVRDQQCPVRAGEDPGRGGECRRP